MSATTWKSLGATLLVATLVLVSGCSALPGGTGGATTTGTPTEATTAQSTQTTTATAAQTTTAQETTDDANATRQAYKGEMTVVVAGDELSVAGAGSQDAGFWFEQKGEGYHVWHAADGEDVTLAEALSATGVEQATNRSLTYDGETYRESADGASIAYRVNGEEVDPAQYVLQEGDEVWVTVETPDMDVDVPGDHIDHEHSHIHGDMNFTVDGQEVDFSREKYQRESHSNFFHFEGGHADPWHAHSWSITLEYAMSTLPGMNVTADSVTYNGTTYEDSDPGTSVAVEVNGEPVDPGEYYLKDGDDVHIEIQTDENVTVE